MKLLRPTTLAVFAAMASLNAAIAQENDEEYTAKILEYTTEPFFLTPHVDHLPASSTVPTPAAILGHIVGAPDVLSYPAEIYQYMRALAAASPRVEVFSIGETEEGRELFFVMSLIARATTDLPVAGICQCEPERR